jgi:2-oxoglutarate dehydrogenase E2 component (dihydrolipoamide succinyltransferase)
MATEITIPALGESISEAVIAAWLKEDGDWVERDEDLVELETDKVTMPLPAPAAGVLKRGADEGDTVEVGGSIGTLDESAEKPDSGSAGASKDEDEEADEQSTKDKAAAKTPAAPKEAEATAASADPAPDPAPKPAAQPAAAAGSGGGAAASGSGSSAGSGSGSGDDVRTTPAARKLAQERGVDLNRLTPTGPGGRIREIDVLAAVQARSMSPQASSATTTNGSPAGAAAAAPASQAAAFSRNASRERMSQLRQRVATRLVEAQQTAAMLTTFNECDMTNVMALRSKHKDQFQSTHGVKLGFMSFFAKAAVSALRAVPNVNAFIAQGDKGPEIEHHDYCDIAFAVGTPKGLVVPVLRNVESLSFAQIEAGLLDLATRARDGKLTLDEMQGGTFTISNGGVYGSMLSTPILNPPQSGILGMHNIIRRPTEHPDNPGEIALRPMMYLALSYDHRIVDGEGAVTFLKHIKECIEDPERVMLGV